MRRYITDHEKCHPTRIDHGKGKKSLRGRRKGEIPKFTEPLAREAQLLKESKQPPSHFPNGHGKRIQHMGPYRWREEAM